MNAQADLDALRDYLATRDVPCPKCSFNLRGGTKPMCPECGEPIRLMVARSEALWTMRHLLVAVVAAQSLSFAIFSLQHLSILARNYKAMWSSAQTQLVLNSLSIAVTMGVAAGLVVVLATYVLKRKSSDGRAVSGLLLGFLLATAISIGWSLLYSLFLALTWLASSLTM
jgi:ABC-type glycerol-3-phosphate transport system permease component